MRAVIQRVSTAKVTVDNNISGEISKGLLVLLGIGEEDSLDDIKYLSDKIINLRIFEDENERMNLSLLDIKGELLIVSQFTLYGDCRKGRRPNFMSAAKPKDANILYEKIISTCSEYDINVESGEFGADMKVDLVNDGPVTILLDSKKNF
ncbi:D-tyrosyl-tRNA(Tyr) deacylase [Clostridium sp. D2Q-11]|uniref:D-aminoacyl-tRNA deacylase n=1 Tax=Anaeromonas frigoriresistens TaxID=2683708 RepID=A0A942Z8D8_9FIRM|nr:D-aminoacyl-tRNA deacylase [Anaeromonas frigoriresistens]MBS4539692.1 D-tyrosyl-tRNA(Tyr) deacylase [Anaeromonas frigoriresistens]